MVATEQNEPVPGGSRIGSYTCSNQNFPALVSGVTWVANWLWSVKVTLLPLASTSPLMNLNFARREEDFAFALVE